MLGVKSMFPVVGGHEGSGIVTEVGTNVTQVAEGDHVAVSFIPSCGTCHWCASGRQNLCDLGMMTLAGGMISDGTYRYHLGGENLNRMAQLGTFADEMVVHENSLVRINPWDNMKAAALISCGIATSFGSAVDRGKVKPGETVVVAGAWPAAWARGPFRAPVSPGARHIVPAVDPVPFKLERAKEIGATHTAASLARRPNDAPRAHHGSQRRRGHPDARRAQGRADRGRLCPAARRTPGSWSRPSPRSTRWDVPAQPVQPGHVQPGHPRHRLRLAQPAGAGADPSQPLREGPTLKIDELITQEYTLDQVQQGYDDQAAGTIVRGVVQFDG